VSGNKEQRKYTGVSEKSKSEKRGERWFSQRRVSLSTTWRGC